MDKQYRVPARARKRVRAALAKMVQAEVARHLDVTRAAVNIWARTGFIPAERVPALASLIGLERYEIRPDLYETPERERAG